MGTVTLLSHTPLCNVLYAIRKCWQSEGASDSTVVVSDHEFLLEDWFKELKQFGFKSFDERQYTHVGYKDKQLVKKIIEHGHTSTLEHLVYTFLIEKISRANLQELARHRHSSLSVESSRYCFKKMLNSHEVPPIVSSGDGELDKLNLEHLIKVKELVNRKGLSNDIAKYGLPEAWETSLVWTINARSLRNFLTLRTSRRALWEIRDLAFEVHEKLPHDHKFLFEDIVK